MANDASMGRTVFVADIHLAPDRPDRTDRFLRFLEGQEGRTQGVYVLGDLFDVWVGPSQVRHPRYRPILERIRAIVGRGLRIELVHGNRDFLLEGRFEGATGIRVHEDPLGVEIGGRRVLLTHGDLLCSADRSYQRTRRVLRSGIVRGLCARLPLAVTLAAAAGLRRCSRRAVGRKALAVLEPTERAIRGALEGGVEVIVCGHLHRAGRRAIACEERRGELVCVGDWLERGSYAVWDGAGLRVLDLEEEGMVITIDGPSGAGKTTVARALARRLGWTYLDTGAMYRAVAWKALGLGIDPGDREAVEGVARGIAMSWNEGGGLLVDGHEVGDAIRSREVTAVVSEVSAHPGVRREMVRRQRGAARGRDLVVEGRDIGTVVFPRARHRFYLDADPRERARRRAHELRERGKRVDEARVLEEQHRRDRHDSTRRDSPLRFEEGMEYVDTSGMSPAEVVETLAEKVIES